jgi:proteasome lid subunit RPN8/RPN11
MKPQTREAAINHAIAAYPHESCGLVVVVKGRERYYSCRNVATSPSEHFVIHPEDWMAAEDAGEITAVVHSHPDCNAKPSQADLVACEATGLPWYILSIGCDGVTPPKLHQEYAFAPSGYEAPLVGREFHFGTLDCYTLIQDYYQRELGIRLPDFERTDGFWDRGENLYVDNFKEAGFHEVSINDMQPHDVVVMQIRADLPNHGAIYIGDDLMLHHLYGRLSSRDVYGGYWKEATRLVLRYKDFKDE